MSDSYHEIMSMEPLDPTMESVEALALVVLAWVVMSSVVLQHVPVFRETCGCCRKRSDA